MMSVSADGRLVDIPAPRQEPDRCPLASCRLILLLAAAFPATAAAASAPIAPARDLAHDGRLARTRGAPVLIVFTRPDCRYCDRVIDHYLVPMQRHPDVTGPLLIRRLDITSSARLIDFRGRATSGRAFAASLKVDFAPTIIVFMPDGTPGAPPLVGLGPEDYYGGFLDNTVAAARRRMGTQPPAAD